MMARLLRLFGVLLIASAAVLAFSRAPDRPVESLVARWAPPPSDFIDVKGQTVHLRDEGPRHDTRRSGALLCFPPPRHDATDAGREGTSGAVNVASRPSGASTGTRILPLIVASRETTNA